MYKMETVEREEETFVVTTSLNVWRVFTHHAPLRCYEVYLSFHGFPWFFLGFPHPSPHLPAKPRNRTPTVTRCHGKTKPPTHQCQSAATRQSLPSFWYPRGLTHTAFP